MSVLNNEGLKHVLQSLKNIIPTKTSELENDSNYQTDTEVSTAITNKIGNLSLRYGHTEDSNDTYVSNIQRLFNEKGYAIGLYATSGDLTTKVTSIVSDLQTAGLNDINLTIDTNAASGTDYEIYTALNSLGWTTDVTAE